MNQALQLEVGIDLKVSGRHGTIVYMDNDRVLVGYADKTSDVFKPLELIQAINQRLITLIDKPKQIEWVINISDDDQVECDRREAYCQAFFLFKQANPTRGLSEELIESVYEENKDEHPEKPSVKTVYAWHKPWIDSGKNMALQVVKETDGNTDWRHPDEVIEFMDKCIKRYYMKDSRPTMVMAYEKFIAAFNRQGRAFKRFTVPSQSTFERRIKSWPKYEMDLARYGKKYADRENREASKTYNIQNVLELVECDGLEVNLGLNKEDGTYAGKTSIIAAIDVKTRACVGYTVIVSKKPKESAAAVIHCLSHSMRLKSDPVNNPASGIALTYVFDNGPGFKAQMTKNFMNAIGSDVTYCRSGAPEEKPHVERMFKTWRDRFFKDLPGYFPKRDNKIVPEKTIKAAATLTVAQFMVMFEHYVMNDYNNRPNRMMNNWTPNEMWAEHARIDEIITLADFDDRLKIRGNAKTLRCNRNHGIEHRGQRFCSTELLIEANYRLGGSPAPSVPMDVLIDDFDASAITVIIGKKMIEVPNVRNVARDTTFSHLKSFDKTIDKAKLPQPLTPRKAANIIKKHRANGTLIEQDTLIIDEEITANTTANMEKDIADNIHNITDEQRNAADGFSFKRKGTK